MKKRMRGGWMAILAAGLAACVASSTVAQTTWDGGGGADTSWGNALNWDNDILPGFDGTDSLTVTTGFGTNTALQLGDNRSISRLTFGSTLTAISLSGYTLRLANTTTTAGAGTALWNANTNDKFAATVNSNIRLEAGTSGNYTGHFREDNNSGGGTRFKPVFDYFIKKSESETVAAMIYLTDMEGNLEECPQPDFPVLWGLVGAREYGAPFGKVVKVHL